MPIQLRDVTSKDAAALAHIVVTANERAFRGLVPDHCLEFPEAESTANWEHTLSPGLPSGDVMLLAEDEEGHVIGYAWGGINTKGDHFQAELRQVNLLPGYQKRGIGRQLVSAVAQRLYAQGLISMCVEVLRINPNRPFYEHLGAQWVSDHPYDWDGETVTECVYGWADIRPLLD